jgi:hypothetical protein
MKKELLTGVSTIPRQFITNKNVPYPMLPNSLSLS